ncbi:hypothetical protein ACXWOM_10255, partial [Streptococcus pyogenes]
HRGRRAYRELRQRKGYGRGLWRACPPCKEVGHRACGAAPRDRMRRLYPAAGAGKHRDAGERRGRG